MTDPVFMQHCKLLACAWHDTTQNIALFIATRVLQQKRICTKESLTGFCDIKKLAHVESFHTFMGGVDTADQRMKMHI